MIESRSFCGRYVVQWFGRTESLDTEKTRRGGSRRPTSRRETKDGAVGWSKETPDPFEVGGRDRVEWVTG